jgi:hypothetical protein
VVKSIILRNNTIRVPTTSPEAMGFDHFLLENGQKKDPINPVNPV